MGFTHGLKQALSKSGRPSKPNPSPYNYNLSRSKCYDWVHK